MSYYNTCPECGAHLDPGEECDCREERVRMYALRKRQADIYRKIEEEEYVYEAV